MTTRRRMARLVMAAKKKRSRTRPPRRYEQISVLSNDESDSTIDWHQPDIIYDDSSGRCGARYIESMDAKLEKR